MAPGIADIGQRAHARFTEQTGIQTGAEEERDFARRWGDAMIHQGGDEQTRFLARQAAIARTIKYCHIDVNDHVNRIPDLEREITTSLQSFHNAFERARQKLGSKLIKLHLQECRALPGYGVLGYE